LLENEYSPLPAPSSSRRHRVSGAVLAATATRLLPLVELLDAIRPQVADESVFRTRRRKLEEHIKQAYAELRADRPKHRALLHTFRMMGELVVEETRDISPDELKQAAKEVVLATLKNAPGLLNAAHQARLLS
jgi:G3E family GTPase